MSAQLLFSELSFGPESYVEVLDRSRAAEEISLSSMSCAEEAIMPPPSKFPSFRRKKDGQILDASDHARDPETIHGHLQDTGEDVKELNALFTLSCTFAGQGHGRDSKAGKACCQDPSEGCCKAEFRRKYNKAVGLENDQERRRQLERLERA